MEPSAAQSLSNSSKHQSSRSSIAEALPARRRSPLPCRAHRGGKAFGPAQEMEGLQVHKLAAWEETNKARLAREHRAHLSRSRRIEELLHDSHRTGRRRADMAYDHMEATSRGECSRMLECAGRDTAYLDRQKALTDRHGRMTRQAWLDRDTEVQRARQVDEAAEQRHFAAVQRIYNPEAHEARKDRDLRSSRLASTEDITRTCRQHRRMAPGMQHSARAVFRRLTPAHTFKPIEQSGQFHASCVSGKPHSARSASTRRASSHTFKPSPSEGLSLTRLPLTARARA